MWTKQQLLQLITAEVIAERLRLHNLKTNYQNVDPTEEILADIELLKEEIQAHFEQIQIILNSIRAEFVAEINSVVSLMFSLAGKTRDKAAVSNKPFIPDAGGHMSACVQIHVQCYP